MVATLTAYCNDPKIQWGYPSVLSKLEAERSGVVWEMCGTSDPASGCKVSSETRN